MNDQKIALPAADEYAPFYRNYVALAATDDIIGELENQIGEIERLTANISPDKAGYAYAEGKWNVGEVFGHLIDGERVFAYRALRISRGDVTPLAGFEENLYVANGGANNRTLPDLVRELTLLRQANVLLFENLPAAAWNLRGTASEAEVSVRALAFIMFGHVAHHLTILRERYLNR